MSGIVGNGFMGRKNGDATLILDAANAAAAYSIRKLRTAYTGNCMIVHDSAFGTFLNIGFDSEGYLNVGAIPNIGDWRVRTWYDQTGNGLDMTTSGYNTAPRIKNAGVVDVVNSLAALKFNGANDVLTIPGSSSSFNFLHNGDQNTFFSVCQFGTTANPNAGMFLFNNSNGTAQIGASFLYDDRSSLSRNDMFVYLINNGSGSTRPVQTTDNNAILANTQKLIYFFCDADNAVAADRFFQSVDGGLELNTNTFSAAISASNATSNMRIGISADGGGSFPLNGFIQEIMFFDTDQSANKATLQTNINNYFSIY